MALQHHYHPLSFPSCSYERSSPLLPSFYCRNQPAHVCFRPVVNGIVLRWALNKALALVMRGSKNNRDFDLEGEIFAFMRNSAKPDMFPSKEELMAAGRVDLVNTILAEGGWLSAGWDSKEKEEKREEQVENLSINGRSGHVFQNWDVFLDPEFWDSPSFGSYQSAESSTSSAQSQEMNHDDGVVGMLSQLEKERAASYAIESREDKATQSRSDETTGETRYSWKKLRRMYGGKSRHSLEYGNPLEKLQDLSSKWEFQETEIMKSRAKLQSIHAKFAILEGKMALEIMEAQRLAEEKQKRVEKAQRILSLLRTTSIVWWSNSGEGAYLAGSFDGWTSQRRMERTSSGAFVINLKLYPGRYEIKFIVDGVWKTDPFRLIVNNDGYENNLLIVS